MKEQEASNMMQLTSTKATCIDANIAPLVDCFRYGVHTGEKQAVKPSRNLDSPIELQAGVQGLPATCAGMAL